MQLRGYYLPFACQIPAENPEQTTILVTLFNGTSTEVSVSESNYVITASYFKEEASKCYCYLLLIYCLLSY